MLLIPEKIAATLFSPQSYHHIQDMSYKRERERGRKWKKRGVNTQKGHGSKRCFTLFLKIKEAVAVFHVGNEILAKC